MRQLALALAFLAAALTARSAEDPHPSITAFKKFVTAVKADDIEGIKRFVVPDELNILDKVGAREKLLKDLAEAVGAKETTLSFKGGKYKGVIKIEPADIPFPVRREGSRWVFDIPTMMESFRDISKETKAMAELRQLQKGLDSYKVNAGHYPSQAQGLHALVKRPKTAPAPARWRQSLKAIPQGPWGKKYQYALKDGKITVRCLGPDGRVSDDDIVLKDR